MSAFPVSRDKPLRNERQLDGSACEHLDCGPASVVDAIDDASAGRIRVTTEQVRDKMAADCRATNPWDWKVAIDAYADRFEREGLQPPRTFVVSGGTFPDLWKWLRRGGVIGAIHYGTVAKIAYRLWSSRSYRGNHAVYFRTARKVDDQKEVPTLDPLADGRFAGIPNGRRMWPWRVVKKAAGNVRNAQGKRIYPKADRWLGLVVLRAIPIGEPDPGIEIPPDGPDEPLLPDEVVHDHIDWLERQRDAIDAQLGVLQVFTEQASTSRAEPESGVDGRQE